MACEKRDCQNDRLWGEAVFGDEATMTSNYRGVYLVGNKKTGRITDVQVVDVGGIQHPLPLHEYVNRGVDPNYKTLPWQEDVQVTPAMPKR